MIVSSSYHKPIILVILCLFFIFSLWSLSSNNEPNLHDKNTNLKQSNKNNNINNNNNNYLKKNPHYNVPFNWDNIINKSKTNKTRLKDDDLSSAPQHKDDLNATPSPNDNNKNHHFNNNKKQNDSRRNTDQKIKPTTTPTPAPKQTKVANQTPTPTQTKPKPREPTLTNPYDKTKKVYESNREKNALRASSIKEAMKFAWDSYVKYAWGLDELLPITQKGKNWFYMGLTIVDSIDTLYLMGLDEEYNMARDWIETKLDHFIDSNDSFSVFEANIRYLGSYLTMYHLTNDSLYLEKAKEMGDIILMAFQNNYPFPFTQIYVAKNHSTIPDWTAGCIILADAGTMFLEFEELSRVSGDPKWRIKSDRMIETFEEMKVKNGGSALYPNNLSPKGEGFCGSTVSMGGMSDSYYEYLLKMALYTDSDHPQHERYKRMYIQASSEIIRDLYKVSKKGKAYLTTLYGPLSASDTFEHLACMAGGMFALGSVANITGDKKTNDLHFKVAKELTQTCAELYFNSSTGLGPEIAQFSPGNGHVSYHSYFASPSYFLRPETIESLFYMYRFTGDTKYQEWGWRMFQSIEMYCKLETGYSGVKNVNITIGEEEITHDDLQQSFFMAETLKYLYLLFSDSSLIPLDKYVFNTEAHPIPIPHLLPTNHK